MPQAPSPKGLLSQSKQLFSLQLPFSSSDFIQAANVEENKFRMTDNPCLKKQPGIFFCVCLHTIHIHHPFTHTSFQAVRQLAFCFPRTTVLFLKQAATTCQCLCPSASPQQQQVPSCSTRKERVHLLGTPTLTRTGEEGSKHQAALVQPELGPQLLVGLVSRSQQSLHAGSCCF